MKYQQADFFEILNTQFDLHPIVIKKFQVWSGKGRVSGFVLINNEEYYFDEPVEIHFKEYSRLGRKGFEDGQDK